MQCFYSKYFLLLSYNANSLIVVSYGCYRTNAVCFFNFEYIFMSTLIHALLYNIKDIMFIIINIY